MAHCASCASGASSISIGPTPLPATARGSATSPTRRRKAAGESPPCTSRRESGTAPTASVEPKKHLVFPLGASVVQLWESDHRRSAAPAQRWSTRAQASRPTTPPRNARPPPAMGKGHKPLGVPPTQPAAAAAGEEILRAATREAAATTWRAWHHAGGSGRRKWPAARQAKKGACRSVRSSRKPRWQCLSCDLGTNFANKPASWRCAVVNFRPSPAPDFGPLPARPPQGAQ